MRQILPILTVTLLIFTGCSTLGRSSIRNEVSLGISSGYLSFVDIWKDQESIYVAGKINKSLGKDLSRVEVIATFMDKDGKVVTQIKERVTPIRTRLHRGRDGRFFIKVPYDSSIKSCELGVEW